MQPLALRSRCLAAVAATVTLLAACASSRVGAASADVAAIRAARAAQNRAIADGDADRIVSFWTDDITVRSGLGFLVSGAAANRERITAKDAAGRRLVYVRTSTLVEVSERWPLAFESGRWSARVGDVRGAEVRGGRYAAQWVKRDGRWLIRSEVFVALTCTCDCDAPAAP
jgi:ketosteroid isomerase-like protein